MKKTISLFLAVMFAFSLCIGSGSMNAKALSKTSSAEKITLKYVALPYWVDTIKMCANEYQKDHPNVNIEVESYPFEQLFEVIEVKMGSGSSDFDLISVDQPLVSAYSFRKYLLPLNNFTDADKNKMANSSVMAGTYKGKLMAAPLSTSSQILFYNKKLLAQAGVKAPSSDIKNRMTWEGIASDSQKVVKKLNSNGKSGIWGFMFDQVSSTYQTLPLPNSAGGKDIGSDGVTVDGIINSPAWVKACKFYYDLFNTYKVSPKGVKSTESAQYFASGKCAYFVGGTWNISNFEKAKNLDYGVAPHPYFKGGKVVTPTGSWHLGVNANSKHPKEAADFVKFMTIGKGNDIWIKYGIDMPSKKSLIQNILTNPSYSKFPNSALKIAAYESLNTAVPRPSTPGYREYDTVMSATFEDIRNGENPKAALDKAVQQLKINMAKYK